MQRRRNGVGRAVLLQSALCFGLLWLLEAADESPDQFALPDFSIYHTKDQVFEEVENLVKANTQIMKLDVLAISDEESDPPYRSSIKVVTVEPGGHSKDHEKKTRLLLNYGEHGRELITVEVALRLLQILADPSAELERADRPGGPGKARLKALLHNTIFKIVPMENERGRDLVEAGNLCERKNGRGVDTNRNWEVHWGYKEKDYDPNEEYPGTKPFSEPEAEALLELAKKFRPHVWMNAHSGMEALFMPYDHLPHIPSGEVAQATLQVLEKLNNVTCGGRCALGSGGKSVGYLAHGTATDYMYERLKVPLAFTWEIYGDNEAHFNDCFRMFNPVTPESFDRVVTSWADAIFALLELLPSHPAIPRVHMHSHTFGRKGDVGAKRSSKESRATPPGPDRKLGATMQGWQSRMNDAARLRAQVFDVPRGRKGLIGGVCVGLVAIVGFVVLVRSGGRAAASKRAARRRREDAAR
ncbi:g5543 [Coccomyxa elongata]